MWGGGAQSAFVAIKLPLLLLAVGACTLRASATLGAALGARLGLRETAAMLLVGLATTARVLLALAPVSLVLVLTAAADPDPSLVGLSSDAPALQASLGIARAVLLWHVVVVGVAGLVGMARLAQLVRAVLDPTIARRVFWTWFAVQGLAGSELSWLFRPFLGKPHLPESPWRSEALSGNFFQEAMTIANSTFSPGQLAALIGLVLSVILVAFAARATPREATLELLPGGLTIDVDGHVQIVAFAAVRDVLIFQEALKLVVEDPETLHRRAYTVPTSTTGDAERLRDRILRAAQQPAGAFRI